MTNSVDPDQLASVCKGRTYPGSAESGLRMYQLTGSDSSQLTGQVLSDWAEKKNN